MKRSVKLVPPVETVRLEVLTAADGKAYVGVELGAHLAQLGEKLDADSDYLLAASDDPEWTGPDANDGGLNPEQ